MSAGVVFERQSAGDLLIVEAAAIQLSLLCFYETL